MESSKLCVQKRIFLFALSKIYKIFVSTANYQQYIFSDYPHKTL